MGHVHSRHSMVESREDAGEWRYDIRLQIQPQEMPSKSHMLALMSRTIDKCLGRT